MVAVPKTTTYPFKILLAEDDLSQASLTLKVFKESKTPFEITRVPDGEEAVKYLKKKDPYGTAKTPDLILLDVNMPKMNGFEVLETVKNDPQLKEIPILMLTCSNSDFDKNRAYEKKANFYIVKPGDLSEFFDIVKYVEQIWISGRKQTE
jgi:two-component system, chemotaxis family, response regulator Rcp1